MLLNLSLRLRVFLIFAALAAVILLFVAAAMWVVNYRLSVSGVAFLGAAAPGAIPALITGGLLAGLGSLGAIAWVWLLFDQNVARPIERLSGGLRTGSTPAPHITPSGSF